MLCAGRTGDDEHGGGSGDGNDAAGGAHERFAQAAEARIAVPSAFFIAGASRAASLQAADEALVVLEVVGADDH